MKNLPPGNPETRFDRGARFLLLFALVFLGLNFAQLAYRFTLPTEGWMINNDDNGPGVYDLFVQKNVVGAPSPLQPGDALHIIGGIPAEQILNSDKPYIPPPAGWQAGGQVPVSVIRSGQTLTFEIPIVNWTFAAWLRSNFADFKSVSEWLSALIMLGVGLYTLIKRPGNLAARFLFLFGLAYFSTILAGSLRDGLGSVFNILAVLGGAIFRNIIFAYMFGPALLGFGLTFPRPKSFIQRRPGLLVAPFLLGGSVILLLFINPQLALVGFPLTLGMILITIGALIHSALSMRDAISRAQMRWAVGGVVLGLGLFTINFWTYDVTGFSKDIMLGIASLGLPVMGISLTIAILRYRLFDIDLIIRRTLVYGALTATLALVYFGSVLLLQMLSKALTGQQSPVVTVISTLLIAALFSPLRRRIQNDIDRRFYRQKYNAEQALAAFAEAARSETDLETLTGRLVNLVDEAMQPDQTSLWLKPTADRRRIQPTPDR